MGANETPPDKGGLDPLHPERVYTVMLNRAHPYWVLYQREQELRALAEEMARAIELRADEQTNGATANVELIDMKQGNALTAFRSVYPANETETR